MFSEESTYFLIFEVSNIASNSLFFPNRRPARSRADIANKGSYSEQLSLYDLPCWCAGKMEACTFIVNVSKCKHSPGVKRIATFSKNWTVREIFGEYHDAPDKDNSKVECLGRIGGGGSGCGEGGIPIDWATPLANLKALGVTGLSFVCSATEAPSTSRATKKPICMRPFGKSK